MSSLIVVSSVSLKWFQWLEKKYLETSSKRLTSQLVIMNGTN
jgi:hypothetical protein